MTVLGKIVISLGTLSLTAGFLLWIVQSDWRWAAAGAAVFFGTLVTSVILSIETKPSSSSPFSSRPKYVPVSNNEDRRPIGVRTIEELDHQEWTPPPSTAPDEAEDPFSRPPQNHG